MKKNDLILEPKKDEKSFVYLLGDSDRPYIYKIGATRGTISHRIKKLQTGNPDCIFLCRHYKTKHPFYIEKQLHKRYQCYNVLNEWYELPDNEVLNFEKTCEFYENLIKIMGENPFFPKNPK